MSSFSASLEDSCGLMSWTAGGYYVHSGSVTWADKHLCRQDTALLHDAGWTGPGREAGLVRCLVSLGICIPVNLVLNVAAFLSATSAARPASPVSSFGSLVGHGVPGLLQPGIHEGALSGLGILLHAVLDPSRADPRRSLQPCQATPYRAPSIQILPTLGSTVCK